MKDRPDTAPRLPSRRNAAPMLALVALVALCGAGAALFVARDAVEAHPTGVRGDESFSLAEIGLESGRAKLSEAVGDRAAGTLADALRRAAGENGRLEFDAEALRVARDADGAIVGLDGYGDDVPILEPAPFGDGWYGAFLTRDPAHDDPGAAQPGERALITGVGTAPDGSLELVQAIVEPAGAGAAATCGPPADAARESEEEATTCAPGTSETSPDAADSDTCAPTADGPSCDGVDGSPLETLDVVRFRQR